jgi:uncharacterized protein DUF3455
MKHINRSYLFAGVLVGLLALSSCQKDNPLSTVSSPGQPPSLARQEPSVPDTLKVPEGNHVRFHGFATGVQIYQVQQTASGIAWVFLAPQATLYGDRGYNGVVATHFAGPTWVSNSGSKVVGRTISSATPNPDAIAWLLLRAALSQGPGPLDSVTFIQRLFTAGGKAPASGADAAHLGDSTRVPYTAEYFFYGDGR